MWPICDSSNRWLFLFKSVHPFEGCARFSATALSNDQRHCRQMTYRLRPGAQCSDCEVLHAAVVAGARPRSLSGARTGLNLEHSTPSRCKAYRSGSAHDSPWEGANDLENSDPEHQHLCWAIQGHCEKQDIKESEYYFMKIEQSEIVSLEIDVTSKLLT